MTLPDLLPPRATALIGGPPGRHTREAGWSARLAAWILPLVALPIVLAVLQREHCVRYGWNGSDQFWRACFSDLPAQYALGNLHNGIGGFADGSAHVDQPALAGAVMSLLGGLVPVSSALDGSRYYFLYWVVLITLLLALTVWCVLRYLPTDVPAAAQVALSPILVLAAVLSSDALAVTLVAGALLAWRRDKVVLTGLLLGLGIMTRSYVVLVALALVLLVLRGADRGRVGRALAVATGAVGAVALVVGVLEPQALTSAYSGWWNSEAGYGSLWLIPTVAGAAVPAWAVSLLAVAGWGLALGLGWLFVRHATRTPSWAQVALIVVAMATITGKAVPVQAALWLLPLAVMAGMRWRDHLIWAGGEALHFLAVWLYVGALTNPDRALPGPWYVVFLLIRLAAITWLVTRIWQDAVAPQEPVDAPAPADAPGASAPSQLPPQPRVGVAG